MRNSRFKMEAAAKVIRARAACFDALSLHADAEMLCHPDGPLALLVRTKKERANAGRAALEEAAEEYEAMLRAYGDGDMFNCSSVRTEPHEPPRCVQPSLHEASLLVWARRRARRWPQPVGSRVPLRAVLAVLRAFDLRAAVCQNVGRQRPCAFGRRPACAGPVCPPRAARSPLAMQAATRESFRCDRPKTLDMHRSMLTPFAVFSHPPVAVRRTLVSAHTQRALQG